MMGNVEQTIRSLSCFRDPQDITPLDGGLTNVNVLVTDQGQKYVVRFGTDIPEHGVMRWNELALSKAANSAGLSPKVIHQETGLLVLEFLVAKTFSEADVRDPANFGRVIDLIKRMHGELHTHLAGPALTFWPYHINRTYLDRLEKESSSHMKLLPWLVQQNELLEISTGQIDLVICHNDLLAANVLDDGEKLWLIDWEYGGFNSPLFDLAGLASNNGFTHAQEMDMLFQYFGTEPEDHWRSYSALKCSSLMRETLWSMTSEIHSELDVDYAKYTTENMEKLNLALSEFSQS